jgi:hypothetical protein
LGEIEKRNKFKIIYFPKIPTIESPKDLLLPFFGEIKDSTALKKTLLTPFKSVNDEPVLKINYSTFKTFKISNCVQFFGNISRPIRNDFC